MSLRFFTVFLALCVPFALSAQKTLTASGTYTYYGKTDISLDQAKGIALERAKLQIIADHFGTFVGESTTSILTSSENGSSSDYVAIGQTEVRGEWLRTIGEPEYEISFDKGMLVITVSVKGEIREISGSRIDVEAKVLCNGTEERFAGDRFREGDDLFLLFRTPVPGYLAAFLYVTEGNVYRLLPYEDREGSMRITTKDSIVLFEEADGRSRYVMTCEGENELDRIYVVFSPKRFTRPNDTEAGDVSEMSFRDFDRWLGRCRASDRDMVVKQMDILISKNR